MTGIAVRGKTISLLAVLLLCNSLLMAAPLGLSIDPQAGSFDVRTVEPEIGAIAGARLGLDVDGQTLWASAAQKTTCSGDASGKLEPGESVTVHDEFAAPQVDWSVEFHLSGDGTQATIVSEIRNRGANAVKLGKCRLAEVAAAPAGLVLGDQPAETVMLVCSGWGLKNRVSKIAAAKGVLTGKTFAPLYNAPAHASVFLGFLTFDRVNTEIQAAWSQEAKGIELRAYCDFEGYKLGSQQAVRSEQLLVSFSPDPQQAMANWADAVAAHYQPRIWPKSVTGWLGGAWVDAFHSEQYETVVRRNASAIRRRLPGFDVEYIWMSLGNLQGMLPGNWLKWNTECFPTPPEQLADDLRKQGFKLGLWMGAFYMCPEADPEQWEELKDALLLRDGKPMVVAEHWSYASGGGLPEAQQPALYALDPTHPKTQAFLRKVLETYYRWGIRYYMIDFLYAISGSTPGSFRYDACANRDLIHGPEVYRSGLKVIRDAAGPDTYLLSSTGPTLQNIGLLDACRMGSDNGEGRPFSRSSAGTFVINQPSYWTSYRDALDTLATTGFMHRKLFVADTANVLTVDKPCPLGDAQVVATIFGINGGPMMLGDDIDRMAEERLRLVKQCLPRMPEAAYALDLFDAPGDRPSLFHLPIRAAWDQWDLVALFNDTDVSRDAVVELQRLSLDPAADYIVWDFWNERFDGVCKGTLRLTAAPQSVKLVRLSRQRPHPWLVSTDMHVRQGQAEIEDCQWDAATMSLRFRAQRPTGERGNAFLLVPPGLRAADPRGLWLATDGRNQHVVARVALDFAHGPVETTIRFEPLPK